MWGRMAMMMNLPYLTNVEGSASAWRGQLKRKEPLSLPLKELPV